MPRSPAASELKALASELKAHNPTLERIRPPRSATPDRSTALASIVDARGRHDEAEGLLRDALKIFERTYGPEHYEVAVILHNLATIHHRDGGFAEAEALYRRALTIKENVLGSEHPELATTLNNLGVLYKERGDNDLALTLISRAVSLLERLVEPGHPTLSACREHHADLAARMRGDPQGIDGAMD